MSAIVYRSHSGHLLLSTCIKLFRGCSLSLTPPHLTLPLGTGHNTIMKSIVTLISCKLSLHVYGILRPTQEVSVVLKCRFNLSLKLYLCFASHERQTAADPRGPQQKQTANSIEVHCGCG